MAPRRSGRTRGSLISLADHSSPPQRGDGALIEAIQDHRLEDDGSIMLLVKWGTPRDLTKWENEDDVLQTFPDMVHEYMECFVDGTARNKISNTSGGVKRSGQATPSGAPTTAPKVTRGKTPERDATQRSAPQPAEAHPVEARPWTPPAGSWEDHVASIDACQFDPDGDHTFYIAWANGQKTKHGAGVLYQKCPRKVLRYYHSHLVVCDEVDDEHIACDEKDTRNVRENT